MLLIGFLLALLPVPVAMVFHGVIQIAANAWRAWLWRHHVNWRVVLNFGLGSRRGAAGRFLVLRLHCPTRPWFLMVLGLMPVRRPVGAAADRLNIERGGRGFPGRPDRRRRLAARVGRDGADPRYFYVDRHDAPGQRRDKAAAQVLGHLTRVFSSFIDNPAGRTSPNGW